MNKVIALVIMIVVCSIYFVAMDYRGEESGIVKKQEQVLDNKLKVDANKDTIQKMIQQIETEYPETPKMLIEFNNRIMQYQYSKDVNDEVMTETLKALRMLYSEELLQLNSYEKQFENLKVELEKNHIGKLYLTKNTIKSIEFPSPENAFVEVVHETTKESERRQYTLVKEKGLWKIHSWSSLSLIDDETILED